MKNPLFSIIIPFFNAARTIRTAIGSVLAQTAANWELIAVDDCSQDTGFEIAQELANGNKQIHVLQMPQNTGSPIKPRELGIINAKGDYIIFLDSDDALAPDYVAIMTERVVAYNTDVVLPYFIRTGNIEESIQKAQSVRSVSDKIISGKEACRLTIPTYRIQCNGMAFRKSLYQQVDIEGKYFGAYTDEYIERMILFHADSVMASVAVHYYYVNPQSFTHTRSVGYYQYLCVDNLLLDFCKQHYPDLVEPMRNTMLSHFLVLYKDFYKHQAELSDEKRVTVAKIFNDIYRILQSEPRKGVGLKGCVYLLNEQLCYAICKLIAKR